MAVKKQRPQLARGVAHSPADSVGIQVPAGRIAAGRSRWQTIFDARDKPSIYRVFNAPPRDLTEAGNVMIVEVDGPRRKHQVEPGASLDVMAKTIRVRAGTGGDTAFVDGWYVLVS